MGGGTVELTEHFSQRIFGVLTLNSRTIEEIIHREDLQRESRFLILVALILPSIILPYILPWDKELGIIMLLTLGIFAYSLSFMLTFRYSLYTFQRLINDDIGKESLNKIFPYGFIIYPLNSLFIIFAVFGQPSMTMYGIILMEVGLISLILKKSTKSYWMIIFTFISFLLAGLMALTSIIAVIYAVIMIS